MNIPPSSYEEVVLRLRRVVRKQHLYDLYGGLLAVLSLSAALAVLAVGFESLFHAGTTARFSVFILLVAAISSAVSWFVVRPLLFLAGVLRGPGTLETAAVVGGLLPDIRDRLVDAIEMYGAKDKLAGHYSTELIDGAFASILKDIRHVDITQVVSDSPLRRMFRYAVPAVCAAAIFYFIFPSIFSGSLHRILHYDTIFETGPGLVLVIEPGDIEVVRGQPVIITVRPSGTDPEALFLHTRPEGRIGFEQAELTDTAGGAFTRELPGVRSTTKYYASDGETESGKYTITVVDRPIVKSFRLTVKPPAYTRLPTREPGENIGDVTALPGSRVDVSLTASKDVGGAHLVFGDSVAFPLDVAGAAVTGSFRVTGDDRYRFRLEDAEGLTNPDPIEYTVKAIPDEYPFVEIIEPGRNLDITGEMILNMALKIRDDFGFSRLRLLYRLEHSRYEEPSADYAHVDIPFTPPGRAGTETYGSQDVYYQWDLSNLSLVPEDVVSYIVEVWDNDNVSGPKSARSESFLLRLPSLEEVLADVNTTSDQSIETMQKMTEELQELKQSLEELNRDVKNQRNKADWQQQKKAEELASRYEALRKQAEETTKAIDEMVKKMDDNKLLSQNTLRKYAELQELLEQLNSPELQEALKKLQESMKKLTPEEMKDAMQKMSAAEDQFRKSLERTVELLKRIHIEQKIDELIARAEDLKDRQDALREESAKQDPADRQSNEQLGEEQSDLGKDAESLEKEAQSLEEKMGEFSKEMPLDEMSEASKSLGEKNVPGKMQESSSSMKSGEMRDAQKQQEQASRDLQEFSDKMREVAEALREKQMKQIVNEMQRQIQNLLDISKNEEAIKEETATMDPNSQRFRESTQKQQETLEDLGSVADAMTQLSKKTFAIGPDMGKEMGNAMKKMDDALRSMEQRNPPKSAQAQKEAMGSMNRSAMMMQGALAGMMNSQGQMGMAGLMGRLGQMSGMQQGINMGTKKAGGKSGESGEGGKGGGMSEYGRLAGEQGAVRKSLQELAREAKNSGELSKILGDLDQIAADMLEVQTDLSQGDVNPETLQKQDRILSRMLESQRSLRERDYEKRRTARSGTNVTRAGPAEIDFGTQEGKNLLRDELFQVREGKYSRDYEELIRKYFEQLEKGGSDQPR